MQTPNNGHTNVVAAGTVVSANQNPTFNNVGYNSFVAYLKVTAASGTSETLSVQFQDSPNDTDWYNVGSPMTATTSAVSTRTTFTGPIGNKMRAAITVGGTTPSYTMSLDVVGCNN